MLVTNEGSAINRIVIDAALYYWLGQGFKLDQQAAAASDNNAFKVTFGPGDWTCTLSRLSGTTNVLTLGF